jgi:hypothetical protein
MGIRTRNLQNHIIVLKVNGTLTAAANKDAAMIPFNGVISNIRAKILTPGSGATNSVLDLNLNGTTVFSAATKITLAATTGVASYSALSSNPTSLTTGSILSLDADSVPTSGACAVVEVTVTRTGLETATNESDPDNVL